MATMISKITNEWNPLTENTSEGNNWILEVQENKPYAKYVPDNLYFEDATTVSLAFRSALAMSWTPGALLVSSVEHLAMAIYFYKLSQDKQEENKVSSGKQEENKKPSEDINFKKEAVQWATQGAKELAVVTTWLAGAYMTSWWLPLGLMGAAAFFPRSTQLGLHFGQRLLQSETTLSAEHVAKYPTAVSYFVEHNIDLGLLAHCLRLDPVTVNTKQKTE